LKSNTCFCTGLFSFNVILFVKFSPIFIITDSIIQHFCYYDTKKLPVRITFAVVAVLSLFIYATFNSAPNQDYLPGSSMEADRISQNILMLQNYQGKCEPDASGLGLSYYGFGLIFSAPLLWILLCM
jgi:hypothetical protein